MFALRPDKGGASHGAKPSAEEGRVLPRRLRRPARMLARLFSSDYELPPFATAGAIAALFVATGIYGSLAGGHAGAIVKGVTARTGFAISDIRVTGNRQTSEIDIFQQLGLDGFTSLIGFDAARARTVIAELPWVKDASVRKVYPNALAIDVKERTPFAIWQHENELSLIQRDGRVIAPFAGGAFASLPLVIGAGANTQAADFVGRIAAHPGLAARVTGYIFVAERRWDLRLENGITVKLPEIGENEAIASLLELDHDHALLSRDILAVDLRLADRLTVQLTPKAAERREASLKQRIADMKKDRQI